jgi:CAAX prenyl protease-like protein
MNTTQEHSDDQTAQSGEDFAWQRHVAPFVAWLFLMQMLGDPAGWKYGLRSIVCLALFLGLRPWRGYAGMNWRQAPLALLVGSGVFAVWVAPEHPMITAQFPRLADLYLRWGVTPFGRMPEVLGACPYAPEAAGWHWALVRLAGSAAVIAVIEEFFWRGFLYRWMFAREFMKVDLGAWHAGYFLLVNLVFGFEHDRWLVGWVAGMAYGWLMWRTRNIWAAALAHGITNYLLGWYVLVTGHYQFW